MAEEYREIQGFDNYRVSNYGNVKNIKPFHKNSSGIIKGKTDKDGYRVVGIKDNNGKRKYIGVHRLVALAFCENENPKKYNVVNHKNGIKDDNRAENLEWCDISYNTKHAFDELGREASLCGYKVIQIDAVTYKPIKVYNSIKEASKSVNVNNIAIWNCINKRR